MTRTVRSPCGGLALALLVAIAAGCGGFSAKPTRVVLITIDTLRPDRISAYGIRRNATPNIDRLAAEGALFQRAIADAPWTTPSLASVMTGTFPTLHGFKSTNAHRLAQSNLTLAEILREHGYETAAIVGSFPVDSIFQLDQGFDHYDDEFTGPIWVFPDHEVRNVPSEFKEDPEEQAFYTLSKAANNSRREDSEVTDAALAWLARERTAPFFLWLHYFGPHGKPDWNTPAEQRERLHVRSYNKGVRATDREVGRFLDALDATGTADRTLVVLHADHGESLGEQQYVGHGGILNEASIRIPMIMRLPGTIEAGTRVARLALNVDIVPTILEALGVDPPAGLSGESLLPRINGEDPAESGIERSGYVETYYPAHAAFGLPKTLPDGSTVKVGLVRRGIRTDRWKYVRSEAHPLFDVSAENAPRIPDEILESVTFEELYDLNAPTGDVFNVIEIHPDVAVRLRGELQAHIDDEKRRAAQAPEAPLTEDMRNRLKVLGYSE